MSILKSIRNRANINHFTFKYISTMSVLCNTNANTIENYLIELTKQKEEKWKQKQEIRKDFYKNTMVKFNIKNTFFNVMNLDKRNQLDVNIRNLSIEQINSLILDSIASNDLTDINFIVRQCIEYEIIPSLPILIKLFDFYSINGNLTQINILKEFVGKVDNKIYKENGKFDHFVAKTIWIKGDIEKAVSIFLELYLINCESKNIIRKMIKYLIIDTVTYKSEASTIILHKCMLVFGEKFNDWFPLSFFWEYCWLSEWFGDQQLANELFNSHQEMRDILSDKLPSMSTIALKDHQQDAILRLLQLLLNNKMMFQYLRVIESLFIYKYKQEDIYGCQQIIKNCSSLNMKLRKDLQTKYLILLISNGYVINRPLTNQPILPKSIPSIKYQF